MRSISTHSASSRSAEWRTVFRANLNFAKKFGSALTPEQRSHLKALSRDFGLTWAENYDSSTEIGMSPTRA